MATEPTLKDLLQGRLANVRHDLEQVTQHLTDNDLDWAPVSGMKSVSEIICEIIATEQEDLQLFTGEGEMSFGDLFKVARQDTVRGYLDLMTQTRMKFIAWIDQATDEDLQSGHTFPPGAFEYLGDFPVPVHEIIRSLAAHEWYHTGQLVSYVWAKGDNPYTWKSSPR